MILTQQPVVIDFSPDALRYILTHLSPPVVDIDNVACEIDNFLNLLHNLLERSEPENFDLIGG